MAEDTGTHRDGSVNLSSGLPAQLVLVAASAQRAVGLLSEEVGTGRAVRVVARKALSLGDGVVDYVSLGKLMTAIAELVRRGWEVEEVTGRGGLHMALSAEVVRSWGVDHDPLRQFEVAVDALLALLELVGCRDLAFGLILRGRALRGDVDRCPKAKKGGQQGQQDAPRHSRSMRIGGHVVCFRASPELCLVEF